MAQQENGSMAPETLDRLIAELNEVERRVGWGRVERIAEVIANYLFGGDLDALVEQGTRPHISMRSLASRPDCPLSKSQLHETLAAFSVYRLEKAARRSKVLTPSHAALIARLPRKDRRAVLARVEETKMGVRELRELIRALRYESGARGGRPPTSSAEKAITRIENAVLYLEEGTELMGEGLPSTAEREAIAELLDKAHELLRCATRRALKVRKSRDFDLAKALERAS